MLFLFLLLLSIHTAVSFRYERVRRLTTSTNGSVIWTGDEGGTYVVTNCTTSADCGNQATCINQKTCQCNASYYTLSSTQAAYELIQPSEKNICGYQQTSKVFVLIVSIVFGGCGVDTCLLARGNGGSICIGIIKGTTIGACGIWYVADIIYIILGVMLDANGVPLFDNT